MEDRHFRDAKGWFSYRMKNPGKNAAYLYILYFDSNANRTLNIEVNGQKVSAKKLEGKAGNSPQYMLLPIPGTEKNKETLNVKFYAEEQMMTSKIIEVRLLTQDYKKFN